jgi:hypothetical protein
MAYSVSQRMGYGGISLGLTAFGFGISLTSTLFSGKSRHTTLCGFAQGVLNIRPSARHLFLASDLKDFRYDLGRIH